MSGCVRGLGPRMCMFFSCKQKYRSSTAPGNWNARTEREPSRDRVSASTSPGCRIGASGDRQAEGDGFCCSLARLCGDGFIGDGSGRPGDGEHAVEWITIGVVSVLKYSDQFQIRQIIVGFFVVLGHFGALFAKNSQKQNLRIKICESEPKPNKRN